MSEATALAYPEAHPPWCDRVHCFAVDGEALHTRRVASATPDGEVSVDLVQGVEPVHDGVAVSEVRATLWIKGNDGPEEMTAADCRAAASVLVAAADALDAIEKGAQP